jgi:anti-anti-sigma factor
MESKINIEVRSEDIGEGIKLIRIDGALDTVTSPKADELISPLLDDSGLFIFDCTNLNYMNSTGLALMLKFHIHLQNREKQFKVVIMNKFLREIMDVSGALKILDVYRTKEEAIESFKKP